MFTEDLLIDELSLLGWTIFDSAVPDGLVSHVHSRDYEICYIVQGQLNWWVNDEVYEVKRGDFFFTKPGELHGGMNSIMERCEMYWLHLHFPGMDYPNSGFSLPRRNMLLDELNEINHRAFPAQSNMCPPFRRLLEEYENRDEYAFFSIKAKLLEILIELLRSYRQFKAAIPNSKVEYSREISQALSWIDEHLTHKFTVADIANAVSLSTSYFHERFSREVGLPPTEFCTRQRIERAQKLLEADSISIAEIAHSVGFSTSQYFATVFKKHVGVSPREFRANALTTVSG